MGRAPCCDKANVKRGPWSPEEDAKLKSFIEQHGTGGNWIALPQKIGLKRCGKSCRLRWLNYLRPNIKHGGFSEEEDDIICSLYVSIGSRWSVIAAQLPGRTDNDIKNYWNTRLKKKLLGKHRKDQQSRCRGKQHEEAYKGTTTSSTTTSSNSLLLVQENSITTTHESHDQLIQHHPYWPHMPVLAPLPYSNQDPCFNDQDSIKRLLIKLGGRFSDDHDHHHHHDHDYCPTLDLDAGFSNIVPHQFPQPIYDQQRAINRASPSCVSNNGNGTIMNNTQETGGGSFGVALEDIVSNAYSQRLDGMEFLYDNPEDMNVMVNDNKISIAPTCSTQTATNWGDTVITSSLMSYPPLVIPSNNYQGMPQECAFQELRKYHGA